MCGGRWIFFADLSPGFVSSFFEGKSAQKNPSEKSEGKSSIIYTAIILDTFLQRGRANSFLVVSSGSNGGVVSAGGSFRKGVRVPIRVPGGGV